MISPLYWLELTMYECLTRLNGTGYSARLLQYIDSISNANLQVWLKLMTLLFSILIMLDALCRDRLSGVGAENTAAKYVLSLHAFATLPTLMPFPANVLKLKSTFIQHLARFKLP
jgi:hypothetical protein